MLVLHGGLFSRDDTTLDNIRALDRHQVSEGGESGAKRRLKSGGRETKGCLKGPMDQSFRHVTSATPLC